MSKVTAADLTKEYSGKRLVPIYKVQRDDQKIALTIDGAWGNNKTEELLKLFNKEDIVVSFFFAGVWLSKNEDLVEKIINSGHEIYNHSYSHTHFNKLSKEEIKNEITKTEEIINSFYPQKNKKKLFRPPYGEYNNLTIKTVREAGYQAVQWSLDSHDWMSPGKNYILNKVTKNISPGDILLFHNNSEDIIKILEELIPKLKKTYNFVSVENLIYDDNYQISSINGLQSKTRDEIYGD